MGAQIAPFIFRLGPFLLPQYPTTAGFDPMRTQSTAHTFMSKTYSSIQDVSIFRYEVKCCHCRTFQQDFAVKKCSLLRQMLPVDYVQLGWTHPKSICPFLCHRLSDSLVLSSSPSYLPYPPPANHTRYHQEPENRSGVNGIGRIFIWMGFKEVIFITLVSAFGIWMMIIKIR